MTYVEKVTDAKLKCAYPKPEAHELHAVLNISAFAITSTNEGRTIYLPFCIDCNNALAKSTRFPGVVEQLRQCEHPNPTTHELNALLPISQFKLDEEMESPCWHGEPYLYHN